jgi:hypothetical protein
MSKPQHFVGAKPYHDGSPALYDGSSTSSGTNDFGRGFGSAKMKWLPSASASALQHSILKISYSKL